MAGRRFRPFAGSVSDPTNDRSLPPSSSRVVVALFFVFVLGPVAACEDLDLPIDEEARSGADGTPGTVTDLEVVATSATSATLQWTEVDDGTGHSAHYAIRWHEHPIGWNWGSAAHVVEGSCASPVEGTAPGGVRTCTAEGLEPWTRLDFQVVSYRGTVTDGEKVAEEYGELSNVATGITVDGEVPDEVSALQASVAELSFTALGQEEGVTAAAYDPSGDEVGGVTLEWESRDPGIAMVDDEGTVTAKGVGRTVVVVSAVCCFVSDSIAVTVYQEAARLVVEPSTLQLAEGGTSRLSARVYDEAGHSLRDPRVEWTSRNRGVARVSQGGVVEARAAGETYVVASYRTQKDSARVHVASGAVGSGFEPRNMPSGFFRIAEHTFESKEMDGFLARSTRYTLASDPTAPVTGSQVGHRAYRVGDTGGAGVALSREIGSSDATEIYLAIWVKFSENFRNHSSGITKIFYGWSAGTSKAVLTARGDALELQSLLRGAPGATGYVGPNRGRGRLERGRWHLVEYVVRSSSRPGRSDGSMQWWLDGTLVGDYQGLDTHYPGESLRWDRVEWNTIWGGTGDEVTPSDGTMYMRAAHLFVGGRR